MSRGEYFVYEWAVWIDEGRDDRQVASISDSEFRDWLSALLADGASLRRAARAHVEAECRCRDSGIHDADCALVITEEALRAALDFEVRGAAGSVTVKIDALATVDTIQPDDKVGES